MAQRCLWLILIALGACFSPKFDDGAIQCGPSDLCPRGFECAAGLCRSGAQPIEDAPPDSPGMVTLTVTRTGTGMGGVTSVPAGLDCGPTCIGTFPAGTMVTLTAAPLSGSTFVRWSGGACSGSSTTCSITLTANSTVTADFAVIMHDLTILAAGNGTGSITSSPAGINCPGVCTLQVPDATQVVLTASPSGLSTFLGWSGGGSCTGTGTCSFKISADTTVTGAFALDYTVVVARTGTGTGTVTSSPAGINCGGDCSEAYGVNTVVTLDAVADGNSNFIGWSGGGCGGAGQCIVTVTAAVMVTAMFDLKRFPLSVGLAGSGAGTVTSNPGGIMCPGDCTETYSSGTMVTLTAAASPGSMFTGWSDASCPGTAPCTVTVVAMSSVTATFAPEIHTLDIVTAGNGAGLVQSTDLTINCGADCSESVDNGTTITLVASASTGSVFSGWSEPGCTTAPMCNVTVTASTTVTATFTLTTHTLTVSATGNGFVTSFDGGINCGSDCTEAYDYGTMVTLVPNSGLGSSFSGWMGACAGNGACVVTMDQAKTVTASFTLDSYELRVALAGMGTGSVTSSPPGITCDNLAIADCTESYIFDTNVTLTANANAPSFFVGWSGGGCSGNANVCVVDMVSAQTVTAEFSPPPNKMFVTSGTFVPGSFGGLGGADLACQNAANAATPPLGGTYRAWLSSSALGGDAIDRLGAASGWIRTDNRPFANDKADIANGLIYHPPRINENGVDLGDVGVGTATTLGGTLNLNDGNCMNYTTMVGSMGGGTAAAGSLMFTNYFSLACNQPVHLYCFGISNKATVIPPAPTTAVRRAFMRFWVPGGGIADADAQCQADATANALPGTYKALLPTTSGSALSRFDLNGRHWVRVDHVPVLPTALLWATAGYFESGPNLSANGTFNWSNYVNWAGAPNLTAIGTLASTCTNWTNQTQTATHGIAGHTKLSVFTGTSAVPCNFTSGTITCLQE